ncbi:MAG: diaminopimelate epimerase [Synechococcus sp. SB0666_bin_14]|nr:diaminopimelate epimerase [Synechococcus sp. SB0666_bin_14]MYA91178.1 diaminopimelate epimerase [Synechococcus sp. SB0663_bin_10]MYG47197.1 diaminopimelate epimerase [Synechococcus sp. SB0675_bin_6]MYJ59726.1 diaminopimelate epimerase [Synechococcus sp. SB0672_bin_6]MYK91238.1 diaminopimelate epimerase [Synechococcus sp. SB0669_bin_8]
MEFAKYQGLGNDFVIVDGRSGLPMEPSAAQVRQLCDRRLGIGADGVILALPPRQGGDLRMRIFNGDGSEPEMCGNGIRCLARFVADQQQGVCPDTLTIETMAGPMGASLQDQGQVTVDMGEPHLEPAAIPTTLGVDAQQVVAERLLVIGQVLEVTAVSMGNPHVVIPVADVDQVDLEQLGPALETHPAFPNRTNVHFLQPLSDQHHRLRTWERGAGPTMACGTGACAAVVAAHLLGLGQRQARVTLPGGALAIDWRDDSHVFMTGPAQRTFVGQVVLDQPEVGASADTEAAAYAQTMSFLANTSLDEMLELAANSLAQRTQRRGGPPVTPPGEPVPDQGHRGH